MNDRLSTLAALLESHPDAPGISDILSWPILRSLSIVEGVALPPAVEAYLHRYAQSSACCCRIRRNNGTGRHFWRNTMNSIHQALHTILLS
ncbi:hypothetical protein [Massilia aurea]|uniref:hypothetical protein n=1 Tax=Massilia aurea TaxID=373040 RepID=UPI000F2DDBCA